MNLPDDSQFVVIREDEPTFRSGLDDFWGGRKQAETYPLVVPLRNKDGKNATQHPRRRLSKAWMLFVRDLNNHLPLDITGHPDPVNVIFKVEAGWINGLLDPYQQIDPWKIEEMEEEDMPKPEFIISSGSVVRIKERTSTGVLLDTFDIKEAPPKVEEVNHMTAATRIIHFMAGHKDGYYVPISAGSMTGQGQDVYFPLLAPGDAWVPFKDNFCERRIEFLPSLPRVVTANASLTFREYPSTSADGLGYLEPGQSIVITKYYPCPEGIWAKTADGWIAIQYLPYKGWSSAKYYTDWILESIPALRPRL